MKTESFGAWLIGQKTPLSRHLMAVVGTNKAVSISTYANVLSHLSGGGKYLSDQLVEDVRAAYYEYLAQDADKKAD